MSADCDKNNLVTLILKYGSEVAGDIYASAAGISLIHIMIIQDRMRLVDLK